MSRLALFDMDRTLVSKETASLYVRYQREMGEATNLDLARTLFWVLQYTFGVLDVDKVADKLARTLEGTTEAAMQEKCDDFFPRYVERWVTERGRQAVIDHRERGDTCAIVTGASLYASRPLAKLLGIPHIVSSMFEIDDAGRFTGKTARPLCMGPGKLERAETFARELGGRLDDAIFYTDSMTDLPLLERVGEPVVVNPDPRLLRVARRRRWRIERW